MEAVCCELHMMWFKKSKSTKRERRIPSAFPISEGIKKKFPKIAWNFTLENIFLGFLEESSINI